MGLGNVWLHRSRERRLASRVISHQMIRASGLHGIDRSGGSWLQAQPRQNSHFALRAHCPKGLETAPATKVQGGFVVDAGHQ